MSTGRDIRDGTEKVRNHSGAKEEYIFMNVLNSSFYLLGWLFY